MFTHLVTVSIKNSESVIKTRNSFQLLPQFLRALSETRNVMFSLPLS